MSTALSRNLSALCATAPSVSHVCREIGLNRQQFARYLNGSARPSAHNLLRICRYFDISPDMLDLPPAVFSAETPLRDVPRGAQALLDIFPGDARGLRGWDGFYHAHYRSDSFPGRVVRALVRLRPEARRVSSATVERTPHPETGEISRARYDGLVSLQGDTLFLVERGRGRRVSLSESILAPLHRGAPGWLTGQMLGFSWRTQAPFTSPCVWRRLPRAIPARDALTDCGVLDPDHPALRSMVFDVLRGRSR